MQADKSLTLISGIMRVVLAAFIAATIGAIIGIEHTQAETNSNLFVSTAGNVATASTGGYFSGGLYYSAGSSSSSTPLYSMFANTRQWHWTGSTWDIYGNVAASCSNCTYVGTQLFNSIASDPWATRSTFKYLSWTILSTYYTSYPDNHRSCDAYYSSHNSC